MFFKRRYAGVLVALVLSMVALVPAVAAASPSGDISGTVFDAAGQPVEGARLWVYCEFDPCTIVGFGEAFSDADGFYRIEGLDDGQYGLNVTAPAGVQRYVAQVVIANDEHFVDVHLGGATIYGVASGAPNPSQQQFVQACGPQGFPLGMYGCEISVLGDGGEFELGHIPDGVHELYLYNGMGNLKLGEVTTSGTGSFEFNFVFPTGRLFGHVLDYAGDPLGNGYVDACDDTGLNCLTTTANADGDYEFFNMPPGVYTIRAAKPDFSGWGSVEGIALGAGESSENDIVVAAGTVAGTVTSTAGPVADANLSLCVDGGSCQGGPVTDASGAYLFTGISAGDYDLILGLPQWTTGLHQGYLTVGTAPVVRDITLDYVSVSGRVLDPDGAAVPGVTVAVCQPDNGCSIQTVTDGDGAYSLTYVPPGDWEFQINDPPSGLLTALVPFTVEQDPVVADITLQRNETGPTGVVTGQLRHYDGTPIAGEEVVLSLSGLAIVGSATTDGDGYFTFDPAQTGTYWLEVQLADIGRDIISEPFELGEAGATVDLVVSAGGAAGYISDADDNPAPGLNVWICGPLPNGLSYCYVDETDQDGYYEVLHVPAGPSELHVTDQDGNTLDLTAGSPIAFDVTPDALSQISAQLGTSAGGNDGYIYGQVSVSDGGEFYGGFLDVCLDPDCNSRVSRIFFEDAYQTGALAGGDYYLVIHPDLGDRYAVPQTIAVTVDGNTQLDIVVEPAPLTTVQGTITYADGSPAANVNVAACFRQSSCQAGGWGQAVGDVAAYGKTNASGFYQLTDVPVVGTLGKIAYRPSDSGINTQTHIGGFTTPVHVHDIVIDRPSGGVDGQFFYNDGAPVVGASIRWSPLVDGESDGTYTVLPTAPNGSFVIRGMAPGEYRITGEDETTNRSVSADVTIGTGIEPVELRHGVLPGGGVHLTVFDHLGAPVEGAYIELCYELASGDQNCEYDFSTDENGVVEILYLDPTTVEGVVYDGGSSAGFTVVVGSTIENVEVTLPEYVSGGIYGNVTVNGTELDEGSIQACSTLRCYGGEIYGGGYFQLDQVVAGSYRLSVENGDHSLADASGPVVVTEDYVEHNVDLVAGSASGIVTVDGEPVNNGHVQACSDSACASTRTESDGSFVINLLEPGDYTVLASPTDSVHVPAAVLATVIAEQDTDVGTIDLDAVQPLPANGSVTLTGAGVAHNGPGQVPSATPLSPVVLAINGCVGGSASYTATSLYDPDETLSGAMTQTSAGHYEAAVTFGFFGTTEVSIHLTCPNPANNVDVTFNVYIDPSGSVHNTFGDPIQGATVVLYRAPTELGPWSAVPDGSDIMAPANRANPDLTDADGHFGWDVVAGFYKVRASKDGCADPADPDIHFVETGVYEIPPPVMDINLSLFCGETEPVDETDPTVSISSPIDGSQHILGTNVVVDYACADEADGSGLASCTGTQADGAALDTDDVGLHEFSVTALDNAGNSHTATVTYQVVYDFGGFQGLKEPPKLNKADPGKKVVFTFKLDGDFGTNILVGTPLSRTIDCQDLHSTGVTSDQGMGALSLDKKTKKYELTWMTNAAWQGTCREVVFAFNDGTEEHMLFEFPPDKKPKKDK